MDSDLWILIAMLVATVEIVLKLGLLFLGCAALYKWITR